MGGWGRCLIHCSWGGVDRAIVTTSSHWCGGRGWLSRLGGMHLRLRDVLNVCPVELLILLLLGLEPFLLLLEFVQKIASLTVKLLRRKLSVLEILHLLLAQIARSLPLTELLAQLSNPYPTELLFLQRNTVP